MTMPEIPPLVTGPLVEITPEEYGVDLDIRYATPDNITGHPIYAHARLFLRPEAARRLRQAADLAHAANLRLVLFDGYRPTAAQAALWKACPDENYVYPPWKGSMHTRGVAVDLTLADRNGRPLDMGTPFDDMSPHSHPASTEVGEEAIRNRMWLAGLMVSAGFEAIETEWWHFQLPGEWPLLDESSLPGDLLPS